MTGLIRTDLTPSRKVDLAASARGRQAEYGAITELARTFGVSRPTVYAAAETTSDVLGEYFLQCEGGHPPVRVSIDQAQIVRAVVALRVVAPNSLRAIETMLPILYPGVRLCYGKIQEITVEAEQRARDFNAREDLSHISHGALDEMFSQGQPVLAGVDLDSGYLFGLSLYNSRTAKDWAGFLGAAKARGLDLQVVVKDAAQGIAAGVTQIFPGAEQRDDCFHAHYEMGKLRIYLERRAYGAIAREIDAEQQLGRERYGVDNRSRKASLVQKLIAARKRCIEALELHDAFEVAMREAQEAMEFADSTTGQLRTAEQMQVMIQNAAEQMIELGNKKCAKVGRYIFNRAPGLASHMAALSTEFTEIMARYGKDATEQANLIYRLAIELRHRRRSWEQAHQKHRIRQAIATLEAMLGDAAEKLFMDINAALQRRHRASSAIEGFNAALRPYLYVQKGVTSGFLELFRAHYNLRVRRWGRHKGSSARQCVTGQPVQDWLTEFGYPPSATLH